MFVQFNEMRVCFVIACHNRRQKTLNCIASIVQQVRDTSIEVSVILLDDGSTDGTADAVLEQFPAIRVIRGSGSLYWNGAMRQALSLAMEGDFDYYVLLNDDTHLYPNALGVLISTHERLSKADRALLIIVGSTQDQKSGQLTYGGWRQVSQWNPLKMVKVMPQSEAVLCDTVNGNCVLLSRGVVKLAKNLDGSFTHSMGDMDYGFRARKLGCKIWVAPGFVGTCDLNAGKGMWTDVRSPVQERWKRMMGPKGLPPKEWLVFTYRHGGLLWPLLWINPYVKFWIKGLLRF
ncbi:MAG: glycosyltransferase family 2 protein [Burkholderiales bacterium]|nr:glycosyltransferase family 2 protein [Burkholderiales bacterium]